MGNSNDKENNIERFTINDIMQGIPGGFFIYHADDNEGLIYVNDAMLHLFRCDTIEEFQELTGNSFKGIVHPDNLERVEAHIAHQIAGDPQELDYVEYRIIRKDGEICWVEDFGHLVHDETEGDVFYVFVSDITERIQKLDRERINHQEMIDAASSRERQYMTAITSDAIAIYEVNLTKDLMEGKATRFVGDKEMSIAEDMGFSMPRRYSEFVRCLGKRVPARSRQDYYEHCSPEYLLSCYEKGILDPYYDFWIQDGRGTWIYAHKIFVITKNEITGDIMAIALIKDYSEIRKKQDQNIKQMEMIQALSVDYTSVYWVNLTLDTVQAFRMSNEIVKNFGNRFQEGSYIKLIQFYVDTSVYEPDREMLLAYAAPEHLMEVLEKESSCVVNYRVMRDGKIEYYRMTASRIESVGEDVEIAIGFSNVDMEVRREMEQRKLVENALAQAQQANSAKTTFLSNMSHDMRTPMNAIIGFSAIAASHIDNTERVKDCLDKIMSSSNHLLSLINDILDMSRIESGKVQIQEQKCNLSELLHTLANIIQPQVKAKQLDFIIDTIDITNEDIYADPLKLNQIFINILGNAVKFTAAGGSVAFRLRQKPCAAMGYGTYEFSIKDTGIGMSSEFLEHIFEPFERESSALKSGIEGTGLGMAITKKLVEIMGGTIRVSSEKGKGTEFVIILDLKLQENSDNSQNIAELQGLRALVVDDDVDACGSITGMLGQIGMRSEWTTSGREAVQCAQKAKDEQDPFHTYILDLYMPEQGGIETARNIRKAVGNDVPIIIVTGYDWSDVETEAKEAGITAFCSKPLFMSDLKAALFRANHLMEKSTAEISISDKDFEGKRVLVVEDNELNREIAEEILQEAGFIVEVAVDGSDAVHMVEKSEEYYYDIILTDIQMPVMDGYEEVAVIRNMKRKDVATMPIIAMTANAFEEDKAQALKCGMNGHIAKPLDIRAVFRILNEHLK